MTSLSRPDRAARARYVSISRGRVAALAMSPGANPDSLGSRAYQKPNWPGCSRTRDRAGRAVRPAGNVPCDRPRSGRAGRSVAAQDSGPASEPCAVASRRRNSAVDERRPHLRRARFSPLAQITTAMSAAWPCLVRRHQHRARHGSEPAHDRRRALQRPAVERVTAYDAKSGRVLWSYDPRVPLRFGEWPAAYIVFARARRMAGQIYVAPLDGLDRARCRDRPFGVVPLTVDKPRTHYHRAPRVFDGKYDRNGAPNSACAATSRPTMPRAANCCGAFHTVPGDPALGSRTRPWKCRHDLDRRVCEVRRWRHRVGQPLVRSRAESRLYRDRQRPPVGAEWRSPCGATTCFSLRSSRSCGTASTAGTTNCAWRAV